MTVPSTLRAWLATLSSAELETVLERSPYVLDGARVRDLDELAMRLAHPSALSRALMATPLPLLQTVEAASALGARATVPALTELLADSGGDRERHGDAVRHWLTEAQWSAFLWLDDEVIHVNQGLDDVIDQPLRIAQPSRAWLPYMTTDNLGRLLRIWGVSAPTRKSDMIAAAREEFADPQRFRRIAGGAPAEILDTLTEHVRRRLSRAGLGASNILGADDVLDDSDFLHFDRETFLAEQKLSAWAASAGLTLGTSQWSFGIGDEYVSEVYLALAPADFHAPFTPEPPQLATASVAAEQLARSCAAAAAAFLGAAMAIMEAMQNGGAATVKSGGIGARELARIAKDVGTEVGTVRLALGLAAELGLLEVTGSGRVQPAEAFDSWRRRPPANRMADLVLAWLQQNVTVTMERDSDGKTIPLFGPTLHGSEVPMPYFMCRVLAGFEREGAVSGDEVVARIAWDHPIGDVPADIGACFWGEGHRLGAIADGAIAPFARALIAGDTDEAVRLLTEALPDSTARAMFGSDLTVLVPGSPEADIVDLLDIVAVRETHGVANSWRVSNGSIRGALDAGYAADDLLGELRKIADTELPQALVYLIRDVSRRHGHLNVRAAAAVVTSDDEVLLAEVMASRSLHSMCLSVVSPTVAVSPKPVPELLAALRTAGYLPVETDDDGAPVVRLKRLPGSRPDDDTEPLEPGLVEPDELSDQSLSAFVDSAARQGTPDTPVPAQDESVAQTAYRLVLGADDEQPARLGALEEDIRVNARRLTPAEAHELADAIEASRSVRIRYQSSSGGVSVRVISRVKLVGVHLDAFCHVKQDDRTFRLDRILNVSPA